eukprot:g32414.t1
MLQERTACHSKKRSEANFSLLEPTVFGPVWVASTRTGSTSTSTTRSLGSLLTTIQTLRCCPLTAADSRGWHCWTAQAILTACSSRQLPVQVGEGSHKAQQSASVPPEPLIGSSWTVNNPVPKAALLKQDEKACFHKGGTYSRRLQSGRPWRAEECHADQTGLHMDVDDRYLSRI